MMCQINTLVSIPLITNRLLTHLSCDSKKTLEIFKGLRWEREKDLCSFKRVLHWWSLHCLSTFGFFWGLGVLHQLKLLDWLKIASFWTKLGSLLDLWCRSIRHCFGVFEVFFLVKCCWFSMFFDFGILFH